jgi:spore coat polysaccharide biosynthesis protein SpsF
MKIGAVIQARMGSTRSKEKILKTIGDKTMLDMVIERTKQLEVDAVILATSTDHHNDQLKVYADKHSIGFFQGSEEDVLQRFIDCAEHYKLDTVVRILCDDPFIDPTLTNVLIKIHKEKQPDYTTYVLGGKPVVLTHSYVYAEVISVSALKKADEMTDDVKLRAHVTVPIYKNPDQFMIEYVDLPSYWQREDIRLTMDTDRDIEIANEIVAGITEEGKEIVPENIAAFLDAHPALLDEMKRIIQEHVKDV